MRVFERVMKGCIRRWVKGGRMGYVTGQVRKGIRGCVRGK